MTPVNTLSLARQQQQAGNLGQAESLCRQVLDAEAKNVEALYLLGVVCHHQGRLDEAVTSYREAIRLKPDFAEAFTDLSHVLAALGRQEESIACYQQGLLLNYQHATGELPAAPSLPTSETAETLNDRGVALMNQGRFDEARACWQQSLNMGELPEVHNNLGFLHAAHEEWEQAIGSYRRALALRPQYADALNNLGIALFQSRQVEEAVRCFRDALAVRPDFVLALNNLGNALLHQGKLEEAGDCYRQVLRLQPDNAQAHNHLGVVYSAQEKWDEALSCWERSLAYNPNDSRTLRNRGKAFMAQGKDADALRSYQQALALNPNDSEVQFLVEALRGTSPLTRVPADYVTSQFDSYADSFDQDLVERLRYRGPELLRSALGAPPSEPALDVLDLGCGTGLCGLQFRDWARTLIGIDLSPKMLERARERGVYDKLILSDLLTPVQAAKNTFDLVLAGDVFVYLGDLGPLFSAVRRALRSGGRFAFTVELLEEGEFRLRPTFRFAHSRAYLRELAAKHGLQEVGMNSETIRTEFGQAVAGLVVVLSRS